jgi:SagB-type dehydrogenase family enzyme
VRSIIAACALVLLAGVPPVRFQAPAPVATPSSIKLSAPAKTGGLTIMEALWRRASVREWSARELQPQELSDLLWAANGINRRDKKRTAPSAINAQDVDVYVVTKNGAYVYDAETHALVLISAGDHRAEMSVPNAPVQLFLVSEGARFQRGSVEQKREWGALDAGIVSQNIALFCAARGLATRPRASFDREKLTTLLKLKESQHAFLNHPVGYSGEPSSD